MSDALTPENIEALMTTVGGEARAAGGGATPFVAYDFKRPNRVSQDQMRSLHNLHERLARNLGLSFSTLLGQATDVAVVSVAQLTYEEFVGCLPSPTCFTVIGVGDTMPGLAAEIGLETIFPIVERMLGGRGAHHSVRRELTEIEWGLADRVFGMVLQEYRRVWGPVEDLDFRICARESTPSRAQLVGPSEMIVVVILRMEFGDVSGTMSIGFPFASLEPLLRKLDAGGRLARETELPNDDSAHAMRSHLGRARVRVGANLGDARIAVRNLMNLREGDILRLNVSVHDEIGVAVNGIDKLAARPVSRAGMKAVRITRAGNGGPESRPPERTT
jgi:flagellar motor switch protein FliM